MNETDSLRKWQHSNIHSEQVTLPKNPPQFERSNTTSPIDQDTLPISNGDPEFDSGKVTTIVKHNYF